MNEEVKNECMELCVTACEKFSQNNEVCICKLMELNWIEFYFRMPQEWLKKRWLVKKSLQFLVKMFV